MQIPPHIEDTIRQHAESGNTFNAYIYDTARLTKRIQCLNNMMPQGVEVFYAMKANPHAAFLDAALKARATGIEIASLGEAHKAIAAGFSPSQLIYTGPGKSMEELRWCVENNIRTIHIESLVEAHRIQSFCEKAGTTQDILLRINAN
ncbi:MAG: alanine racemase, partial [Ghiorsea sp.]|nr:alanine racemase [Ghiorsea sp.]